MRLGFESMPINKKIMDKISKLEYSKERSDTFNAMSLGNSFEYRVLITRQNLFMSSIYEDSINKINYVIMCESI